MKKDSVRILFIALISAVLCVGSVFAQKNIAARSSAAAKPANLRPAAQLFVDDFTYPTGALLTDNGWTAHSGAGTNSLATVSPGLTLAGYPGSGVGNAVAMTTSGEDVNHAFPVQTAGSVYAAFMVNVSDASATAPGGYFFHFGPDPVGSTFRARVFAVKDGSNNLAFGVSVAATSTAGVALTPYTYSMNTTYLIVVKYNIVDGTANDTAELFVSTTVPGTEPTPTLTSIDTSPSDISPGTAVLRQGTTSTSATLHIDGVRVGTSWADVTQASTVQQQHVLDYNGDGKTDYAVVRSTLGGPTGQITWFECNSTGASQSCSGDIQADFGLATDFFVSGDFDGDSKSDITVWRAGAPEVAAFYIFQSSDSTMRVEAFGQTGDDPTVVSDYTGDGKTDVAVYRDGGASGDPSFWFYRASSGPNSGNVVYTQWGSNGDFPAPGDYDGDGTADFMIQRNGGGGQANFWLYANGTGAASVYYFGTPTDVIVPGDYDGDGTTDLAVVRGNGSGNIDWYVRKSSSPGDSPYFGTWGLSASDFPTQGDYDGDGKTDLAVFRPNADPTQNFFYVRTSSAGALAVTEWGQNADYPVANYNTH